MVRPIALLLLSTAVAGLAQAGDTLPIRGLHVSAPKPEDMPLMMRLIEALPKEGVNTLVIEFDYQYQFTPRPEVAGAGALSRDNVQAIAEACRKAGIKLIPQINLLGHQSWGKVNGGAAPGASGVRRDARADTRITKGSIAAAIARCTRRCTKWSST